MVTNFSWVIPERLAGSALPDDAYRGGFAADGGSAFALSEASGAFGTDLQDLYDRGIRCLVSLTNSAAGLASHCRNAGLDWHFYPIPDFGIPESIESFDRLITTIIDSMNRDRPVCVHCFAGIGRTGLVLCCTVGRYMHLPATTAIAAVRRVRSALETRDQERFVHRYLDRN